MASPNLQEIHDFLFELALKAGDMITSADPGVVDTKKNCTSALSKRGTWDMNTDIGS
jgi:hypothetical protein